MSKHENELTAPEAQATLAAVDAALRGDEVPTEHAQLGTLVTALRETRPRASEHFVRALDARAGEKFARKRPRRVETVLRHRAFAVAVMGVIAVAIVVPIGLSGSGTTDRTTPKALPKALEHRAAEPAEPEVSHSVPAPSSSVAGSASSAPSAAGRGARQVEHAASLDVGVAPSAMQSAAQQVFTLASAFHGYVQQSSVSSGGGEQGGASFQLRVPSANLPAAIAALAHLGHVRSENETTNDVTEALGSLQRALADAKAERASLLAQLARTSEAEAAEALKRKLAAVDVRVGQLEGSIRSLTSRVDYTNVALSLTPERQSGASAGDLTPSGALHDAGLILGTGLSLLVLAAAVLLPLAIVVLAAAIALAAARRRLREQALEGS